MKVMSGFSINIKVDGSMVNGDTHIRKDYIPLNNGTWYTVVLNNRNPTKCDVELFIDKIKMGKWRIKPYSYIEIDRPVNTDKRFYFVEENSTDASFGNVVAGSNSNGLITATFYPEYGMDGMIYSDMVATCNSTGPNMLGFNVPTRIPSNCYGAQCTRASYGSSASVMNENLSGAPLCMNSYRSGATVLKGTSNQTFGKLPPITDIDTHKITDLSVRLVVDRYLSDRVYPLSGARNVPPRIDSAVRYDDYVENVFR